MAKRSIQIAKPGYSLGIEHDQSAVRAARVLMDGRGGYVLEGVEEARGEFQDDAALLEGLRRIKAALGVGSRETAAACLSGKQVFATQMDFRRLGAEEMEQALRLEVRKSVHFEVATSTLDYLVLDEEDGSKNGFSPVLVGLSANSLLSRELGLLEKAGFRVSVIDILPVAIANALWASREEGTAGFPAVALHIGPQVSTIVVDGEHSPFYTRSIPFAAEEISKGQAEPDRDRRFQSLAEEISRSLAYYEKNIHPGGFQELVLLGEFLDENALSERIPRSVDFPVRRMDLGKAFGSVREASPGKFDLAISLALRGGL
jgi:Tfp pilus assembly PilM family ATPase